MPCFRISGSSAEWLMLFLTAKNTYDNEFVLCVNVQQGKYMVIRVRAKSVKCVRESRSSKTHFPNQEKSGR